MLFLTKSSDFVALVGYRLTVRTDPDVSVNHAVKFEQIARILEDGKPVLDVLVEHIGPNILQCKLGRLAPMNQEGLKLLDDPWC